MLILTRKVNEQIYIGRDIIVQVVRVKGERVRIGVMAPPDVPVMRSELLKRNTGGSSSGPPAAA